jgi:drug/metabolite transporter (DMT)-like permease
LSSFAGETAALVTAFCWAFTSVFFTLGANRIGSVRVNRVRLLMAFLFLSITHLLTTGTWLPIHAGAEHWFWLGTSGLVGFVIGDAMLFEAFVVVGTRVSMLLLSLVPIMSALFAWVFLGELLSFHEVFAIVLTVGGIVWVVFDKNRDKTWVKGKRLLWGIALGVGGALGQTFGLILSKKGLEGGFPALSGNLIRVSCAVVIIWILAAIRGRALSTIRSLKDTKAFRSLVAGSFFGPFVGVWLSLVAIKYARIGIAATLMSITPIILIPISYKVFKDRITIHSVFGTVVAIVGVAILLLTGQAGG